LLATTKGEVTASQAVCLLIQNCDRRFQMKGNTPSQLILFDFFFTGEKIKIDIL